MLRERIVEELNRAIRRLRVAGSSYAGLPDATEVQEPAKPEMGDYASNYALVNSKAVGMNPRALGEALAGLLSSLELFSSVEVAGPGFLNFRLRPSEIAASVGEVLALGPSGLPRVDGPGLSVNVEFVSVNPNGPITIGSGRGAAFGSTLCNVLDAAGFRVFREFYVNDALNSEQMRLFAVSVQHYLEGASEEEFPEGGYRGEYVRDVAERIRAGLDGGLPSVDRTRELAEEQMIARQREDLSAFGVTFDAWFSEKSLHLSGAVDATIELMRERGNADTEPVRNEVVHEGKSSRVEQTAQEPGPLWLRTVALGDDKDRVLLRSDGRPAYIAGDLAYMANKLTTRGFDRSIMILGPDHHGYLGRLRAVAAALGYEPERFTPVIYQLVRFLKDGKPAPMRKRDGNIYELRDLVAEVGVDVARFFYLMRSHDSPMDFDIDLALKSSDDNPVFYVQYAHARIASVLARGREAGLGEGDWSPAYASLLEDARELALIKKILDLPEEVRRTAADFGVHRLTTYAVELSRAYHHFYDACRVVQPDAPGLSRARLALCRAAQVGLRATLDLLEVSAPERMEREPVSA